MPKQDRSKTIYDSIIQAAERLYCDIGFSSTTTNKIAEKAGVGIGSIYRYFPDKNAILKKVTQKFIETNHQVFTEILNHKTHLPLDFAIQEIIDSSVDYFLSQKNFYVIFLVKAYETGMGDSIYECRQQLASDFSKILLARYPEQIRLPEEQLQSSLYMGFHGYMSSLLAYMQKAHTQGDLEALKYNLTEYFRAIVVRSNA